jgi:outer membrane protein OmpA-like peptidoglycan-associated protein
MTGATCLLLAPVAQADEVAAPGDPVSARLGVFSLKLEPGVAFPLSRPQSELFNVGGGQTVKALWLVGKYVDLGPSATYLALPSGSSQTAAGTAWTFGASLRLKRPHDAPDSDRYYTSSPWVDVDALYVRTGSLNRPGFALAAGLSTPIGQARAFWVGPFVRYLQVMQGDRAGFDNRDAKILSMGVSLEVGAGIERERKPLEPRTVTVDREVIKEVIKEVLVCADRDKDDVPDQVDLCPDVVGTKENWGCPQYKKLVVKRDKLELKEKLYFAWNQAVLQEVSFPVLDEVVQALKDNKSFRVQVAGHSSSEGREEHNQTLSEKRATAVLDYLVAHGIERERLASKGFGSSLPADSNDTVAGRENNRRVVFVVNFVILNDGSKQH